VDGELRDLARTVDDGAAVSILTADGDGALARSATTPHTSWRPR